jgi:hypothetical protein
VGSQFRNEATAKNGGEQNPDPGAQSRTSMVAFREDRVRRLRKGERSLNVNIADNA